MKKYILILIIIATHISCKKGEKIQSHFEDKLKSSDSIYVSKSVHSVGDIVEKPIDSVKIKALAEIQDDKEKTETPSKNVDSISDKTSVAKLDSKNKKKDSIKKKDEKIAKNTSAPKVIQDTKVIHKEKPKIENFELNIVKNKMIKSGFININVNNAETVKQTAQQLIKRNKGFIQSENMSYISDISDKNSNYESYRTSYQLYVKIPIQNFDDLMNALNYNLGKVESKKIEVSGDKYIANAVSNITVTLTDKSKAQKQPKTFSEKSFAAIESGWGAITSIFLFFLPLWPLIIVAGVGYYFYKKNRNIRNKKIR